MYASRIRQKIHLMHTGFLEDFGLYLETELRESASHFLHTRPEESANDEQRPAALARSPSLFFPARLAVGRRCPRADLCVIRSIEAISISGQAFALSARLPAGAVGRYGLARIRLRLSRCG